MILQLRCRDGHRVEHRTGLPCSKLEMSSSIEPNIRSKIEAYFRASCLFDSIFRARDSCSSRTYQACSIGELSLRIRWRDISLRRRVLTRSFFVTSMRSTRPLYATAERTLNVLLEFNPEDIVVSVSQIPGRITQLQNVALYSDPRGAVVNTALFVVRPTFAEFLTNQKRHITRTSLRKP